MKDMDSQTLDRLDMGARKATQTFMQYILAQIKNERTTVDGVDGFRMFLSNADVDVLEHMFKQLGGIMDG